MSNKTRAEELIRKAVPSLLSKHTWEVGNPRCTLCLEPRIVKGRIVENRVVDEKSGGSSQTVTITEYDQKDFPCLKNFKRITLESVLEAIDKSFVTKDLIIELAGGILYIENQISHMSMQYALSKPFSDQPEALYTFIVELLDKK